MSTTSYIFLDEAGNFDFSQNGTKHFVITSVTMKRPFVFFPCLDEYKYDCLEYGIESEYFHCAEDNSHIRERVFDIISKNIDNIQIDAIIVNKTIMQSKFMDEKSFYIPIMCGAIGFAIKNKIDNGAKKIILITDTIPIKKRRELVEKAIKQKISSILPKKINYTILHNSSKSHYGLQIADYCCWSIFRKWERLDEKYYDKIASGIRIERQLTKEDLLNK